MGKGSRLGLRRRRKCRSNVKGVVQARERKRRLRGVEDVEVRGPVVSWSCIPIGVMSA
jgi:hypothetical protein